MTRHAPRQHAARPPAERDVAHPVTRAATFWECASCGFLSNDPAFGRGEKPCKACGATPTEPPREFPPERLRRLDARIRQYHDEGEAEIVVIMVATFLETMLEDLMARIMESQGADEKVSALVLDTQRSIGQRLGRLFPKLTGTTFEDSAARHGHAEFPRRWRALRATRNAFIHDTPFEGALEEIDTRSSDEAMKLLDEAYDLFVKLNNEFAVSEARGRTTC